MKHIDDWTIEDTIEIWVMVNNEAEGLDGSDEAFMHSIGWILGIEDNPTPNGKKRKPKALDKLDKERLKSLIMNIPL